MDRFEFFFTFYGLILGLAAAEILSGIGAYVRARPLRTMEPQSALLALLTFLVICGTWIEAWWARDGFVMSFASMLPPIGAATAYYLAAVVVLPKEEADYDRMDIYFRSRKNFVVTMLIVAEVFVLVIFLPSMIEQYRTTPAIFWLVSVPFMLAIFGTYTLMLLARTRRLATGSILLQILIFTTFYWSEGWIGNAISRAFDYE